MYFEKKKKEIFSWTTKKIVPCNTLSLKFKQYYYSIDSHSLKMSVHFSDLEIFWMELKWCRQSNSIKINESKKKNK